MTPETHHCFCHTKLFLEIKWFGRVWHNGFQHVLSIHNNPVREIYIAMNEMNFLQLLTFKEKNNNNKILWNCGNGGVTFCRPLAFSSTHACHRCVRLSCSRWCPHRRQLASGSSCQHGYGSPSFAYLWHKHRLHWSPPESLCSRGDHKWQHHSYKSFNITRESSKVSKMSQLWYMSQNSCGLQFLTPWNNSIEVRFGSNPLVHYFQVGLSCLHASI